VTSRLRHGGAPALTSGVLLLALAGCGSAEDPGAADPAGPAATTGTASASTTIPASAGPAAATVETTGTLEKGVEAGCLVFTPEDAGSGEVWTLTGDVGDLRPGQRATIRGSLRPDAVSFCQQGQVFEVSEVLPR
jgi:hypothetical protein